MYKNVIDNFLQYRFRVKLITSIERESEIRFFLPFLLFFNFESCTYQQQQNKWYLQRCLLGHVEATLD